MKFTIWGNPIAKPRMVKSDKWKKRPCVEAYFRWVNYAKYTVKDLPNDIYGIAINAYIEFPKSYSQRKMLKLANKGHRQKPDCDNILKAVMDALIKEDKGVCSARVNKYWDDGNGARVEVEVW